MTENGDSYENAIAERVNGILKHEFLMIDGFSNHLQVLDVIKESIGIYNESRSHLSCQMLTLAKHIYKKKYKKKMEEKKPESFISLGLIYCIFEI